MLDIPSSAVTDRMAIPFADGRLLDFDRSTLQATNDKNFDTSTLLDSDTNELDASQ